VYNHEYASELKQDPLKQALRTVATIRLVDVLPPLWQHHQWQYVPPSSELAHCGNVGGTFAEPDAPDFMADFWGNGKLFGWWFKAGFPGLRYEKGQRQAGDKDGLGYWVYEL